ncbi:MAG: nitrilase-related carbon-nitrogen hydrolase [Limisphaerales bacterium]
MAYSIEHCQILIVAFLYCLFRLADVSTSRRAFYIGLGIGLAIYAPQLSFFWTIFQAGAISLWLILSIWLGFFLLLGRGCRERFGLVGWACAAPFVWTGLEYSRSELYYLRFSWLGAGYAFSDTSSLPYLACYGVYGIGFMLMTMAAILGIDRTLGWSGKIVAGVVVVLLLSYPALVPEPQNIAQRSLRVTGVQLEFPSQPEAVLGLDQAIRKFPETDLLVLSEYTFNGPIPEIIKKWCRNHKKYLVVGGEELLSGSQYYNTAFVIGPKGEIVFQKVKCVPVQFMKDGLPAPNQTLWNSPWGKLGFAICYDASYTRVTDELIRQGAQGLIFPTMDTRDWGGHQHQLHARIAPMRAAEYAVPVFRLCSSGISQYAGPTGQVLASAPFPGQGAIMSVPMKLADHGRMPPDRWLAPLSVGITVALSAWLAIDCVLHRPKKSSAQVA